MNIKMDERTDMEKMYDKMRHYRRALKDTLRELKLHQPDTTAVPCAEAGQWIIDSLLIQIAQEEAIEQKQETADQDYWDMIAIMG
jgi:hypothetical protein